MYGSPATFIEQGMATGRTIRTVIYRDNKPETLIEDSHSEAANALLSPADFLTPNRMPQQFDLIRVTIEGFDRIYTIDEIHPVLAETKLALIIASIRAN
jgi:hypothetical protein